MKTVWMRVLSLSVMLSLFFVVLAQPVAASSCVPVPAGLVGWWSEDGHGDDLSGHGNHSTSADGVTYQDGVVGPGLSLHGNGRLSGPTVDLPLGDSARTLSAWIKTSDVGSDRSIIHYGGATWDLPPANIHLFITGSGLPALTNGAVGGGVVGTMKIDDGEWHLVTAVFEGLPTKVSRIYVDGKENNSAVVEDSLVPATESGSFTIGAFISGSGALDGNIDETQIYNRALTAEEIQSIYAAGSAGVCKVPENPAPQLVAWWPGNGDAVDVIGGNNGTISGATFAQGVAGQGFSFDGIDDYVHIPASADLNVGSYTIESWVFPDINNPMPIVEWNNGSFGLHLWLYPSAQDLYVNDMSASVGFPSVIKINQWNHVAVTYDMPAGLSSAMVNGQPVATWSIGSHQPDSAMDLYFGWRPGSVGPGFGVFSGRIDEVKIYNGPLTLEQVQANYRAGSAGTMRCAPLAGAGPVSHWEGEGSADDGVGTNNGTLNGAATYAAGKVGEAFSFDGAASSYVVAPANDINGGSQVTYMAWVKPDVLPSSGYAGILGVGDHTISMWDSKQCRLLYYPDGKFYMDCGVNNSPTLWRERTTSATYAPGAWYHLAGVFTNGKIDLYVNGVLDNGSGIEGSAFVSSPANYRQTWFGSMSRYGGSYSAQPFAGLIDDAQIYSRALSAEEVAAIYGADQTGVCKVADVVVSKSSPIPSGTGVAYTLTITNNGPFAAANVIENDLLPTGARLVSLTTDRGLCNNYSDVISCNLGDMPNSATATINIAYSLLASGATLTPNLASPQATATTIPFTAAATGGDAGSYEYRFWYRSGTSITGNPWTLVQNYSTGDTWSWNTTALAAGTYQVRLDVRHVGSTVSLEGQKVVNYNLVLPVSATAATLVPDLTSPQLVGTAITLTGGAVGGDIRPYEYRFWYRSGTSITGNPWILAQNYSTSTTWSWDTAALAAGTYQVRLDVRHVGATVSLEVQKVVNYTLVVPVPATAATLVPDLASPRSVGSSVILTGGAVGGDIRPYEYRFWYRSGTALTGNPWILVQNYSTSTTWSWDTAALAAGTYQVRLDVRHVGATVSLEVQKVVNYTLVVPVSATAATLVPDLASPQLVGTAITLTGGAVGGDIRPYEYRFWYRSGTSITGNPWTLVQNYSTSTTWSWDTAALAAGTYQVRLDVRHVGATVNLEVQKVVSYNLLLPVSATAATLVPDLTSPRSVGTAIVLTGGAVGGDIRPYEYRFWYRSGTALTGNPWTLVQNYSTSTTWSWNTTALVAGTYQVRLDVRHVGATVSLEVQKVLNYSLVP